MRQETNRNGVELICDGIVLLFVRTQKQCRSELEASYAKGLAKLASKLLKTTGELQGPHGTVTAGWSAVAMKMESEAELHK